MKFQRSKMVPTTRKEVRREKRQEKKLRQQEHFKRRRENKFNKLKPKHNEEENVRFRGKKVSNIGKEKFHKNLLKKDNHKQKNSFQKPNDNNIPKIIEPDDSDFEDEEIDSDIPSGSEDELPQNAPVNKKENKSKKTFQGTYQDKITQAREREKEQLQEYEEGLRQRRIEQLEAANEEENKVISKYEKLLKLNKRKGKKEVPMSFNDGLDYILELCTNENIEKMYTAAKEANELDADSDDDSEMCKKLKKDNTEDRKAKKLKKAEEKYFGEDDDPDNLIDFQDMLDDGMDTDDSETDQADKKIIGKSKNNSKKVTFSKDTKIKEADSDGDSDFDLLDSENEEMVEEFSETESKMNASKNNENRSLRSAEDDDLAELFKNKKRKNYVMAPKDLSDEEETKAEEDDELAELFKDKKKQPKKGDSKGIGYVEDIYGRKRDSQGNIIKEQSEAVKYVPPHLRAKQILETTIVDPKKQEQLNRLKKQLKGQINRLAEANIQRIAIDIENLYMQHPRHDMNTTITDLLTAALVSNVLVKERMVLEHILLLAVLHVNIGSEIGAFFLEHIIQKFNSLYEQMETIEVENKEIDNYILIACHMYTFKLFQHNLIYNILEKLTEIFNEKSVECILLVLRSIGFSLRKDDPLALKDLVLTLQKKANDTTQEMKDNIRVKYMLDTLLAIKNNNMTKIPNYDPSLCEHFRKLLKSLTHDGKYVTTLNITVNDLLNADRRGKWWLVGSAWAGNEIKGEAANRTVKSTGEFSAHLLELARKQRMNTDDRRNVFCIIMSAEDYIDAFDKLLHLSIKDPRVIVTVIIQCGLSEKQFNPYYAVLAQKFIDHDRKYHQAVQYALWDRIKDLSSLSSVQQTNLGNFIINIVQKGGLAISVLKVIDFLQLDKTTHKLVRHIIMELLLSKDDIFTNVFSRIAPSNSLKSFKDSIKLFMHHFLLSSKSVEKKLEEHKFQMLQQRIGLVDKLFESGEHFVMF